MENTQLSWVVFSSQSLLSLPQSEPYFHVKHLAPACSLWLSASAFAARLEVPLSLVLSPEKVLQDLMKAFTLLLDLI